MKSLFLSSISATQDFHGIIKSENTFSNRAKRYEMAEKIVFWYNYCLQKAVYDGNSLNYPWQ